MATAPPQRNMQGIAVPASSVNTDLFFERTDRQLGREFKKPWTGLGGSEIFEIRKTGILYGLILRLVGSVTVTPGAGTVATTARWPYDLIKSAKFTANGQSNLINVSGLKLKARDFMGVADRDDRGVSQSVANAQVAQGTLSNSVESWGLGSRQTAIGAGTYDIDLFWHVPIAENEVDLHGAIFAATSSTDLTLAIDWATPGEVLALTGNATAVFNLEVQLHAKRCVVPLGPDGQIVVPDLSTFHSLIQTRHTDIANGMNEVKLVGQGAGKTLLRMYSQLWNGAAPGAPLPVTAANFSNLAYRYSSNETPNEFDDVMVRYYAERNYNTDIGRVWGFWAHDFMAENAFRDAIDLGTTSEFRQLIELKPAVALAGPAVEVVAETMFTAGAGA